MTIQYEQSHLVSPNMIDNNFSPKVTKDQRLHISENQVYEVTTETSAATVKQEGIGANVTVVTAVEAPVDVSVVTGGSLGRAGTGLAILIGIKTLEAECSLRYSPPFSS